MSLKYVIGSSGSGKSTYIYKKMIEDSVADMRQRFLVIVPEQFTLETQRRLVELHPAHSIVNIDILSFDRLAYRVFDEMNESGLTLLDDVGKNLILRRVAEEVSDELLVLKRKIKTPGYIDQVKSLLSEFEQYNSDGRGIDELAEVGGMSPAFKNKIHDISIIHEHFLDYISGEHITAEQRYMRLAQMLRSSSLVRAAVVVLDGYTGFTPIQNVLLEQIISLSRDTYVTVTMDVRETIYGGGEHELFYMSKKMIRSLSDIAKKMGVTVDDPILIEAQEKGRFAPSGRLAFLEKNIFSELRKNEGHETYEGKSPDEIRIFSLDTPYEELCFTASMIRRMVADSAKSERPLKYSDLAIVSGAPETYSPYIEEVFARYDVPVFSDEKTDVVFSPCLEFLISALSILNYDFKYDDVIGFLRTGLADVSSEDTDLMDQYLYRTGIRGKSSFSKTFMIRPSEFSEDELSRVNELRHIIYDHFEPLIHIYYETTPVSEKTAALRSFLEAYGIREKLEEKRAFFEEQHDEKRAMEYGMVYDSVIELFEKMDALLPDIDVSGRQFSDILTSGLEAVSLGTIPQDPDRVLFGDVERTRLSGIKRLFLIGANDGVIPSEASSPNILSQNERMILSDAGIELAPTVRQRSFMQRFYLYQLLTQGSDGLYITYACRSTSGESLRPSYIVDRIRRLYDDVETECFERAVRPDFWTSTDEEAKGTFIMLLRRFLDMGELSGKNAALFGALLSRMKKDRPHEVDKIFEAAFFTHSNEKISTAVMRAISGEELHVSVSRIEKYAACAYAYFLNYGLRLKERREHEFEYSDMGTLYHEALKNYSELIHRDNRSWRDVSHDESEAYLKEAVIQAYDAVAKTEMMETHRKRYIMNGMERTLRKTVWAIHRQLESGDFEPAQFEVSLSKIGSMSALTYELSDSSRLVLSGQIDRIDTCEKGDRVMVKIVDYKSGNKALDYMSMYYGLQIQLVFYMNAAIEGMQERQPDRQIVPAAFFYYHIDDPMIEGSMDVSDDELFRQQMTKLKPTGSIRDDAEVVASLDEKAAEAISKKETYKSDVAKIDVNKTGGYSAYSDIVSEQDMSVMRDYVKHTVRRVGEDMISGRIDVDPYRNGNKNACTYCQYRSVCGFEPGLPGYGYHNLAPLGKKDEIIAAMKESLDND
ncbi:MAG: PD-(D/E)XK nuclease family protein [Lachnospiraceae bacterium]|nr:PD-(D/E)XK nuclease family protein [Lachnospiraceae bacterium]